jgi:RNA polymerase sigma-70 factor (sigma-E family)
MTGEEVSRAMGTDPAFDEFVASALPPILRFARVLTGNEHDAWDLAQDAFARVGARWSHVESTGNPVGYVRTAVVRLNLNRLRRLRREVLTRSPPEPIGRVPEYADVLDLETALSSLPPRQRATLVLRFYEDLSVAETAQIMRCSEGTVKTQTSRGLAALRERWSSTSKS